jgi:hypothetical protein
MGYTSAFHCKLHTRTLVQISTFKNQKSSNNVFALWARTERSFSFYSLFTLNVVKEWLIWANSIISNSQQSQISQSQKKCLGGTRCIVFQLSYLLFVDTATSSSLKICSCFIANNTFELETPSQIESQWKFALEVQLETRFSQCSCPLGAFMSSLFNAQIITTSIKLCWVLART